MKKILFAFAALVALAACGNKQTAAPVADGEEVGNAIPFEVAKNYFYKGEKQRFPCCYLIATEEDFQKNFGMATTMGEDGKPTEIDFTKQCVLAVVPLVTDVATEITPLSIEEIGDKFVFHIETKKGEKLSYSIQPVSLVIIDKQYEDDEYLDKSLIVIDETQVAYTQAVDAYLINQFAKQYAPGEHSVPLVKIVDFDNRNPVDILVWGDFWIFNYNQVGDTLKCVSGGSHPGLIHLRQADNGLEVTAFDQVEDGSRYLPTAKKIFGDKFEAFQAVNSDEKAREMQRFLGLADYVKKHNLTATLYQDYGWPAKPLP